MSLGRKKRLTDYANCAGCAAKLPMGALAQVLRGMPKPSDPNLLVGADHFDDAGVYRLSGDMAVVMTVDFFPPLVDDPYAYGQVAAANSLSDIYAMGGQPRAALNIVGYPDRDLPLEWLEEILKGGAERITAAGAVVAGGHSVRDTEVKYGLSVTGVIHPDRIFTNGGARPGDVLVLTKPLGTGILTTAAKDDKVSAVDLAAAVEVMSELNRSACEAVVSLNGDRSPRDPSAAVHALTDITGFGLLGHSHEMAEASGTAITISAAAVPLLPGALALAEKNLFSRACKSNLEYLKDHLVAGGGVKDTQVKILADAQTSGGLLIAVAADRSDELIQALRAGQVRMAAIVGRVDNLTDRRIRVT